MTSLTIKYTEGTTFKYVHDLIEKYNPETVCFEETEFFDTPVDTAFLIGNIIKLLNPNLNLIWISPRTTFPTTELSPDLFFRGIPFDELYINNTSYIISTDGKIIKDENI